MSNSFGRKLTLSTFGESHGAAIGCVLDGVPAGLKLDKDFIQSELDRRKPGQNSFQTQRKEDDIFELLSGEFEGLTTGTPLCFVIRNTNQKSKDYSNVKDIFRPGHADMTYFLKYGLRDYRGGGRSSARETAARVAAAAVAKLMLKEIGVEIQGGLFSVGSIEAQQMDFGYAKQSDIYALDKKAEAGQKALIEEVKQAHDSIGGAVFVKVKNPPFGLGEPLYGKLDAVLAEAMMGINGAKAVEIGEGVYAATLKGSENNDELKDQAFLSNHSGGILGGISTGEDIDIKVHFKPTPSIFQSQQSIDAHGEDAAVELRGRHDPCIAIRGSVVAEAMAALVVADMVLLNLGARMEQVKKAYTDKNLKNYFK